MRAPIFVTSLALVSVFAAFGCASSDPAPINHRTSGTPPADDTTPGTDDTKPVDPPGTPPDPGTPLTGDETWDSSKTFTGSVTIPAGKTVTIAAGASISVPAGFAVTVNGTIKSATPGATHAKITGTGWAGIVVAQGGTMTLDSVDLTGAKKALWTQKGNTDATYANGVLSADVPFTMEAGSKLSISKSTVTAANGQSSLMGTFNASYMTYDKGTNEGFTFNDAAGTLTIIDSTLKGNGGGDYVVVDAAATMSVTYTTISGSHCPFHFGASGPTKYTVDHVSDDSNGYGWMLYGSGAGPSTISNSNFRDQSYNIEMTGTNGAVTLTNNYFGTAANANKLQAAATTKSTATAPITDAKPHP
jgi:hypothetical protein